MKRRVLRAHANKKHLRLVCASNHLALDAYNILCDSSFIRAVVLHFLKKPHIVPRGQRLDAAKVGTLAASLMRELIDDAFNATDSAGKGTAAQSVGKPSGAERVRLNLFYLPETRTALLRMCNDVASTSRNQNLRPQQASSVSDARVKESAGGSAISTEMISAVLATMRCLAEKPASTSGVKEVRAIAGLMTPSSGRGVAPVDSHSGPTRGVKNENHYFIATQNHDVRRALPPQAGLLRLTQQPEGVWIEQAAEYTYTGSRDGANSFLSHQSLHFGGGKALSAADVAFMRSLGTSETPSRTATQKPTQSPTAAPAPATEGTIQEEAGSQPPKPKRKRKRGQASPNPLSMKKKQHREVFRADG